jgi:Domain of unknown function (DUF4136)
MLLRDMVRPKPAFLAGAAALSVLLLVGCDEYVRITHDPDLRIAKHATWAWRPESARDDRRNSRRVISRDEIGRQETVTREPDANNDFLRGKVKMAIEQTLSAKGLKQVGDPDDADFLVDFSLAVRRRNVTVERVYPGAYPGLVCGPFGCWEGVGWGPPAVGYEHIRFREGTIVIDLLQQPTNHLAYRAVGEKPVKRDMLSFSQDEVNSMVHRLLKDLKTRK